MQFLKNDDVVRLTGWSALTFAHFFDSRTHEAYRHMPTHDNPCLIYTGTTISRSTAWYLRQIALAAKAIVLEPGEIVSIDGRPYRTVVARGNMHSPVSSSPVTFEPIEPVAVE